MLCLIIIIIIIDFYTAYLKGVKVEKIKNKIITIKPNKWKKTFTPIRKLVLLRPPYFFNQLTVRKKTG